MTREGNVEKYEWQKKEEDKRSEREERILFWRKVYFCVM